ncbi:RelA/SpoT domain-containing protein, partial [Serratia marcescens]
MLNVSDNSKNESILLEYKKMESVYHKFSAKVEDILLHAIKGIKIINVNKRVKTLESLSDKLIKKQSKYNDINEITDIVGVRVITLFSDDVDGVARIVESEFDVDIENSIDKRKSESPDKFGYMSLHYVIQMKKNRTNLPEYKEFAGLKAEIQIRTSLQHSWAEMEHGLQYKNSDALPYKIRRQLSSLSSLLETADSQLVLLKDFENELIDESTLSLNKEKPENVALNKITLPLFFKDKNSIIYKIRDEFLNNKSDKELNVPGVEKLADFDREGIRTLDSNLSFFASCLHDFEIFNFQQLYDFCKNRSDVLLNHSDKINEEILRKPSAININNFFFMFLLACIYD